MAPILSSFFKFITLFLFSLSTATSPPATSPTTDTTTTLLKPPFSTVTPILTSLGFHDLAIASHSLSLSSTSSPPPSITPITVFAPTDASLRSCVSCSLSILLQEHSVPGLYPLSFLRRLAFGTKIESILPGRCLTVTTTTTTTGEDVRVFVGGVEVTHPELYADGHVIVHGITGYLSHLSPYSCAIDKMTSLLLPHPSPSSALARMMLADAMIRLRTSGYSILALAMRVKYAELVALSNLTMFAVDDTAVFHGGHSYVHSVRFHIIPNRLLTAADLEALPAATVLPTLENGECLTVTSAGGSGGAVVPMRINYVRIKHPDMILNDKVVVHGLASPFPRLTLSRPITTTTTTSVSGNGRLISPSSMFDRLFGSVRSGGEEVSSSASNDKSGEQAKKEAPSPAVIMNGDNGGDYHDDIHQGL